MHHRTSFRTLYGVCFIFSLFQYQNKSDRIILPGAFRDMEEVYAEVLEDSGC